MLIKLIVETLGPHGEAKGNGLKFWVVYSGIFGKPFEEQRVVQHGQISGSARGRIGIIGGDQRKGLSYVGQNPLGKVIGQPALDVKQKVWPKEKSCRGRGLKFKGLISAMTYSQKYHLKTKFEGLKICLQYATIGSTAKTPLISYNSSINFYTR